MSFVQPSDVADWKIGQPLAPRLRWTVGQAVTADVHVGGGYHTHPDIHTGGDEHRLSGVVIEVLNASLAVIRFTLPTGAKSDFVCDVSTVGDRGFPVRNMRRPYSEKV